MTAFWWLIHSELSLIKQTIKNKLINTMIWAFSMSLVYGHIMPSMGLMENFGAFQVGSLLIDSIGTELYSQIFSTLADLEGPQHINYHLTLPISSWLVLAAKTIAFAVNGLIISTLMLPLCTLVLWSQISLRNINYANFLLILLIANIFFAWFSLMLSSMVRSAVQLDDATTRILFPLWIFGCSLFSFKMAYKTSKFLGTICLLSPYTYAIEATRSCIINNTELLPFWLCVAILSLMTVLASGLGYYSLKKRLDFI